MRNSLIFKLMGAFILVIAIGTLVMSVFTSQATRNAFDLYTTRSGQVWAQRLAPDLADFYARSQSWQGVDELLQSVWVTQTAAGGMGNGMGSGQGREPGTGRQNAGSGMAGAMGQRLILANEKGQIVGDTQDKLVGKLISLAELKNGAAITVNDNLVGTLIVTPNDLTNANTPAGQFLASVNQAITSSAGIASLIALVLGTVLFLQIIKPLRQLKDAAAAIASGDLEQRVSIHSRDELGELGQTFNHMAESLARAETQRQHLVADVAHELRTPLAAIQATLDGMQDGVLPMNEEQIAVLQTETMLLGRLVGDLRFLSLAEAGQLKLERQETSPAELIQKIVERIRPQADQNKIKLETDVQAGLPSIWVDSDRLTQVLINLVSNSLRYTPEGGFITIQAARLANPSQAIQISVTDSGPGIDFQHLPFVFDRFYRVDKSRTRSSGGSGLGLAIVKQLVEAHGGMVHAESPVFQTGSPQGYGARIIFTIPFMGIIQD